MASFASPRFGIVIRVPQADQDGEVLAQNSRRLLFPLREWTDQQAQPFIGAAVEFKCIAAPQNPARRVATIVRPAPLDWQSGTVTRVTSEPYGFLRLDNGVNVYFVWECVNADMLRENDRVRCAAVPGRDSRWFALAVEPEVCPAVPSSAIATDGTIGVCTQKGARMNKSVNDDAFFICELESGEAWLLAVADGVSYPANGWWASDKCMELLWQTVGSYEEDLRKRGAAGVELMRQWICEIRELFLGERLKAPMPYKDVTSTLSYACVFGHRILYAHCGDTRLYVADPVGGFKPQAVIANDLIERGKSRSKLGRGALINHIGSPDTNWDPIVGEATIPQDGVLLLCTDGVIAGEKATEKFLRLSQSLKDPGTLQDRVTAAVERVAILGETDDLTLIAFQPGA